MLFQTFKPALRPRRGVSVWSRLGHGAAAAALALGVWPAIAQTAAPAAAKPAAPAAAPAPANDKVVTVVLTQSKVVKDAKGKETLVAAPTVEPGDIIEYTATYTNKTGKAVSGLQADLPIPEGLEYIPRSAKPGANLVKAAVKGGEYAAEPLVRALPNGKTEPVPYSEYRALRWALGQLPAEGVTAVTARAKVQVNVPKLPVSVAPATPQAPPAAKKP